ncbi:Rap1-interacting factor 1 N terminal-domain-containing protein [Aspergillus venezuelensis]
MVDVLGPLSARPPTPPRTATRVLSEKDRTEESPAPVQTPNESPFLRNGSTGAPSSRQSKRVNFSPWPKFIKPPSFTNSNTKSKVLLPSNEQKPMKSILKATNSPGPVGVVGVVSYTPETFAMLLESVTQQLAGESTSSRIDAYMQFFGALRAYEKLPTEEEILRKLGLISQFIQRDISRDLEKGGPLDTNLVIQALKLSVVLVWHPQISPQLPDEFKLFLVEHSISCLEDGKQPKSVMTHYLTVLSTQKFPTRIINNARATRILEMLHGLTDRVKGNSVVSQRLLIYDRLFELNKSTFIAQCSLWMDHLISGLLHQIKNVRLHALDLGFNAYMASGVNSPLSKTLRDIFDRPLSNNRKLVSEISERMSRMMSTPETGEHVPQIWGVITLLLRNKRFNIEQWQYFKDWVLVLQRCFNCSDPEIKSKAHGNWNRFVLVVNLSETTSQSLLRMLSKPIISQFERKKHDRNSQPSQLAVASYYNLLYYAFRPDASFQQFDIVWEEYIASPSSKIFTSVPSLSDRLAHALSHMLWSSHPKAWSENRVNEPKRIVAEELPPLDCKWVRSRISAVLKVIEDVFKSSVWGPELEESNIAVAWVSLSQALALAASKEITPSPESMQTVAHILGLLQRLWITGPSSLNASGESSMDTFFERFRFISTTMVTTLGTIPFTEKLLLKTADSTYQASTPTHRHSKTSNNPDIPILHLLRLVSDVSGVSGPTPAYSRLVNDIIQAACHGKVTRASRLDMLRQFSELYSSSSDVLNFSQIVWTSTAQLSADCLSYFPTESARERDGSVARDYDSLNKILMAGWSFLDNAMVWDRLLDAFTRVLRTEKGDQALVTMVLEPLAAGLLAQDPRSTSIYASSLIKRSLSIAFSNLTMKEMNGNFSAPPFPSMLVTLTQKILSESYGVLQEFRDDIVTFLESLVSFLGSGTLSFRSQLLDHLQYPLGLYLKDEQHKLTVDGALENRILSTFGALSTAVLNILRFLPHDSSTLQRYEGLICSGLESPQMSIANQFGKYWKNCFDAQRLLVSPAISRALGVLAYHIVPQLPRLAVSQNPTRRELQIGDSQVHAQPNSRPLQFINSTAKDMSAKSRLAYIMDASTNIPSSRPDSPSITRVQSAGPTLQQTIQPVLQPTLPQVPAGATDNKETTSSAQADATQHRKMFSMIDNLRSSSPPTTTPRDLGFMTPPHLRNLRNEESGSETPQTPMIPAIPADKEEGFLGSSPTPAIRGRTSSVASASHPSISAVADSMEIDPPSSPPELEQQATDSQQSSPSKSSARSRNARNRRRNRARRSKTPNQGKQAESPSKSQPAEENNAGEVVHSLRSRLRSAIDCTPARVVTQQEPEGQTAKVENVSNDDTAETPSQPEAASQPEPMPEQQPAQADVDMDSASEDTDTQAMSQLENDLVYAVDSRGEEPTEKEIEEYMIMCMKTPKRLRKGEKWNALLQKEKERRRSSRITPAAEPASQGSESQLTRSKKRKLSSTLPQETPSPATTAAKKRKQEAVEAPAEPSNPSEHETDQEAGKESQNQGSQTRRSGRISGIPAPEIREESPAPKKSTPKSTPKPTPKKSSRPNSARKSNKRKSRRSQTGQFLPAYASEEKETSAARESSHEEPNGQLQVPTRDDEPRPESLNSIQPEESEPRPSQEAEKEPLDVPMTEVQDTLETSPAPESVPEPELGTFEAENPKPELEKQASPEPPQAQEEPELPAPVPQQAEAEAEPTRQAEPEKVQTPEPEQAPAPAPAPSQDAQISTSLRSLIDQVRSASLDRNALKEIDDLLFDLRFEMHEALRRHRDPAASSPSQ